LKGVKKESPTYPQFEGQVIKTLLGMFPFTLTDFKKVRGGLLRAKIERRDVFKACKSLKDNLGFEHLSMITAVEYDDRFEIVYHVTSYDKKLLLELITTTPKDDPTIDSISSIWGGPTGRSARPLTSWESSSSATRSWSGYCCRRIMSTTRSERISRGWLSG